MTFQEKERAKQEMAQAKALLESALASRERTQLEAVSSAKRQAEEEVCCEQSMPPICPVIRVNPSRVEG